MKKQNLIIRLLLVFVLTLLVAVAAVGCGEGEAEDTNVVIPGGSQYTYNFTLKVVGADGNTKSCPVVSNCETVGEALIDAGLIEGEEGPYGLYVKKVCGETADYDKDGTYWALYVGGEYSTKGVDTLKCSEVTEVEFRVEK